MLDTLFAKLTDAAHKIADTRVKGLPRALIYCLLLLLISGIVLYFVGWLYLWKFKDEVNLPALNALIQTMTSGAFIAAAAFFGKALIDKDDDGIPDNLEGGENNDGPRDCGPDKAHREKP